MPEVEQNYMPSAFWAAFYAGMASPVALYGAPPAYGTYIFPLTPAQSFGVVGSYLTAALSNEQADGRSDVGSDT
jgi:hypothetical protein